MFDEVPIIELERLATISQQSKKQVFKTKIVLKIEYVTNVYIMKTYRTNICENLGKMKN